MTHTSTEQQPEALRLADTLDLLAMDLRTPRAAAKELRRLHARVQELEEEQEALQKKANLATSAVYQFHYAMKDAGWHPGRTDDDLTDIIRAKGRELARLSQAQRVPLSEEQRRAIFDDLWPHGADAGIRKLFTATVFATEAAHGITQEKHG